MFSYFVETESRRCIFLSGALSLFPRPGRFGILVTCCAALCHIKIKEATIPFPDCEQLKQLSLLKFSFHFI